MCLECSSLFFQVSKLTLVISAIENITLVRTIRASAATQHFVVLGLLQASLGYALHGSLLHHVQQWHRHQS